MAPEPPQRKRKQLKAAVIKELKLIISKLNL
jgi:hypothetical protein